MTTSGCDEPCDASSSQYAQEAVSWRRSVLGVAGFQIGSGMIESMIRPLVGLRLEDREMRWVEVGSTANVFVRIARSQHSWAPGLKHSVTELDPPTNQRLHIGRVGGVPLPRPGRTRAI